MKRPKYNNIAAKYFYVKMQEARAWRARVARGEDVPPPPGNPYITAEERAWYWSRKRKWRRF